MAEEVKSRATGYTLARYIKEAIERTRMPDGPLAQLMGTTKGRVYCWCTGQNAPCWRYLRKLESASGMAIAEYLPEATRGYTLLKNAAAWRDGFRYTAMRRHGVGISWDRYRDALNGIVKEEQLTAKLLIDLCGYYDEWSEGRAIPVQPVQQSGMSRTEEQEQALRVYKYVTGTQRPEVFGLQRKRPKLWICETGALYRIEIDLKNLETRVYWKPTGALSLRRPLHAVA